MAEALASNFALLMAAMVLLWLLSLALGKVSFVDGVWGLAMAGLATASFLQLDQPSLTGALLGAMPLLWGVRLGVHLLRRFMRNGEDARYVRMLADARAKGWFALTALWKVFLLQGALIMLVSSPAQVGILAANGRLAMSVWGWLGVLLFAVGWFFEVVGDAQLQRFKADPASQGKVMDKGLWRYTRHPNYFGDACVWWGIWLAAMSVDPGAVVWTLPGPLFLTFTLVKWSGAAMTEGAMREKYGEEFADYVRRTPAFVPWFPNPRD